MRYFAALLCLSSVASAQEQPALAAGGFPPSMCVVEGVKEGKLTYRQHSFKMGAGQRQESGAIVFESATPITVPVTVPLSDVKAFDLEGKPIATEKLAAMFPRPTIVLFAFEGTPVDPAFLKIAREGTVLILVKSILPAEALVLLR